MALYAICLFSLSLVLSIVGGHGSESESNLVFYVHDIAAGANISAIPVAGVDGPSSDFGKFGTIYVTDDRVTLQEHPNSTTIGRAQGLYLNPDSSGGAHYYQVTWTILLPNHENEYDTLQLQGVDRPESLAKRELSVVGGTGRFRFARGYAIITTKSFDGMNAVIQVNVSIRT